MESAGLISRGVDDTHSRWHRCSRCRMQNVHIAANPPPASNGLQLGHCDKDEPVAISSLNSFIADWGG